MDTCEIEPLYSISLTQCWFIERASDWRFQPNTIYGCCYFICFFLVLFWRRIWDRALWFSMWNWLVYSFFFCPSTNEIELKHAYSQTSKTNIKYKIQFRLIFDTVHWHIHTHTNAQSRIDTSQMKFINLVDVGKAPKHWYQCTSFHFESKIFFGTK